MLTVVSTSFMGGASFDKTRFTFVAGLLTIVLQEIDNFHMITQCLTRIVVLSTVVPTSVVGVDSFDKMIFRFIAGHPSLSLWETKTGGRGELLPFHLIAQR